MTQHLQYREKKNENCNKKVRKNMCEDERPVHKMVAVTSTRPKLQREISFSFLSFCYTSLSQREAKLSFLTFYAEVRSQTS